MDLKAQESVIIYSKLVKPPFWSAKVLSNSAILSSFI